MCLSARLHKFLIKRNDSQFSYNSLALPPPLRSKDSRQEVSEPTPNFDKLIGRSSSFPPLPSLTSLGSHAGHVAVLEPIMMSSEEHGSTSCLPWATWREANPQVVSEQEHRSYPFLSCSKPVSPLSAAFCHWLRVVAVTISAEGWQCCPGAGWGTANGEQKVV